MSETSVISILHIKATTLDSLVLNMFDLVPLKLDFLSLIFSNHGKEDSCIHSSSSIPSYGMFEHLQHEVDYHPGQSIGCFK